MEARDTMIYYNLQRLLDTSKDLGREWEMESKTMQKETQTYQLSLFHMEIVLVEREKSP
jgi:hypothetical protein